ncbi:MAG: DUF6502 family protein [Pseudomonadota bacterium]
MALGDPDTRAALFLNVARSLLRPLIRALIAQGVTLPSLYRLIKRVYVEVAEDEFGLGGKPPTDSRISLLTGVHRRDIRAFRAEETPDDSAVRRQVTALATILARWLAGPDTVDADGRPRALPRSAAQGVSFEALARDVSSDIRPRTMLDELERQGLVAIDDKGLVHLRQDAFLGPADQDQRVHFFAANVGDHISAAVANLLSETPPYMERAVFYNRLTPASLDAIEAEARTLGSKALVALNRMAHQKQAGDLDAADGTQRFRFGVFFYRVDESEDDTLDPAQTGSGEGKG